MSRELVYYKKTVPYHLGVRRDLRDTIGELLTGDNPFVGVEAESLRDFKVANKRAIVEGLIEVAEEPTIDWDTPNTISDTEISDLLKQYLKLKSKMLTITSTPIAEKFMVAAKAQNKSSKIIGLIQERLDELNEEMDPNEIQRGVE